MGYSLQLDTDITLPLASNQGWADFCAWAETTGATELRHFVEYGWSDEVGRLGDELAAALKEDAPARPDVRSTAAALAAALKAHRGADVATVTDGLGAGD